MARHPDGEDATPTEGPAPERAHGSGRTDVYARRALAMLRKDKAAGGDDDGEAKVLAGILDKLIDRGSDLLRALIKYGAALFALVLVAVVAIAGARLWLTDGVHAVSTGGAPAAPPSSPPAASPAAPEGP